MESTLTNEKMDSSFRWNDVALRPCDIRTTELALPQSYLYMMSNKFRGTLYIGVTSDLIKRTYEHRHGLCEGFTKKYGLKMLVWYAVYEDIREAIHRETQMKAWRRQWKIELIEKDNPYWHDLYDTLI